MPTPPFSPQNYKTSDENTENPLNSTINLLDSLVAFYQQERMWVYRTQAVLDDAFSTPSTMESPNTINIMYSDHHLSSLSSKAKMGLSYERNNDPRGNPQDPQASRWARRKKGFKLRIDDIRAKRIVNTQPVGETQHHDKLRPRKQILEMFDKMMETRLESCQRVNKLIREANRATLHRQ